MSCFDQAFSMVVDQEGGYGDASSDPGNWTGGRVGAGRLHGSKFGISAAAYPTLDIAGLGLADAKAIYERDYWDRVAADRLSPALALLVFDAAVNNGVERAAEWLQSAVGALVDGKIGDQTLAAVAAFVLAHDDTGLCVEFMARRLVFMTALPTWQLFGPGWARRLCSLPYQSLSLTDAAS